MRHWRHLPLRRPAPGGLAAAREPQRCDIVAVRTATMSHRCGCGAVAGAAAARREGPPGPARREGCARSRRPAGPALAGRQLTPEEPHPCRVHIAGTRRQFPVGTCPDDHIIADRCTPDSARSCGNGDESSPVPTEPNAARFAGVSGTRISVPSSDPAFSGLVRADDDRPPVPVLMLRPTTRAARCPAVPPAAPGRARSASPRSARCRRRHPGPRPRHQRQVPGQRDHRVPDARVRHRASSAR